jgi:hypothetical protein
MIFSVRLTRSYTTQPYLSLLQSQNSRSHRSISVQENPPSLRALMTKRPTSPRTRSTGQSESPPRTPSISIGKLRRDSAGVLSNHHDDHSFGKHRIALDYFRAPTPWRPLPTRSQARQAPGETTRCLRRGSWGNLLISFMTETSVMDQAKLRRGRLPRAPALDGHHEGGKDFCLDRA